LTGGVSGSLNPNSIPAAAASPVVKLERYSMRVQSVGGEPG
jgi:hypothetical protein